jgi:hypothetical protein
MTDDQMESLYAQACLAVGYVPNTIQYESWEMVLLGFNYADLQRALQKWWSDTTPVEWHGTTRCKGSFMPAAADLKALIYDLKNAQSRAKKFVPCHRNGCQFDGKKRVRVGDGPFDFEIVPCECRLAWEAEHGKLPT